MSTDRRSPGRLDAAGLENAAVELAGRLDPDADLEAMAATFNLVRAATEVVSRLETAVHRPAGGTWAGFRLLFCLRAVGPLPPSELARLAGVSRPSVSAVLNTLERDGLVRRGRLGGDGRRVEVALTGEGRGVTDGAWVRQHALERRLLGGLDPAERAALAGLLRRLLRALPPRAATAEAGGTGVVDPVA